MPKDGSPEGPAERRRRSRLYALRAMDRLGLLGEGNLIPTLARRPQLKWLADEGKRGRPSSRCLAASATRGRSRRPSSECWRTGPAPGRSKPNFAASDPAPSVPCPDRVIKQEGKACMLGPFFHTPPPTDEKGKKEAWAVAWMTLVMGFALVIGVVMLLLSVLLPT